MPAMEAKLASTYYEFFRCTYNGLLDEEVKYGREFRDNRVKVERSWTEGN